LSSLKLCVTSLIDLKENNLEILINPIDMHFITNTDDPYIWKVLPEKEYLFKKHLSKYSIRVYIKLWWEVGVSFEAVLASKSNKYTQIKLQHSQQSQQESSEVKVSFTARIDRLELDNTKLSSELNYWRD